MLARGVGDMLCSDRIVSLYISLRRAGRAMIM